MPKNATLDFYFRMKTCPFISYALKGEDRLVLDYLGSAPGTFFEAGANEPIAGSQTYLLESTGWSGILVEANPDLAVLCRQARPRSKVFGCALFPPNSVPKVQFRIPGHLSNSQAYAFLEHTPYHPLDKFFEAETRTMDEIMEISGFPKLDYLSLDLEGGEAGALSGFSFARWQPKLISVEDHCGELRTHKILLSNGYKLVRRVGDNHWYIPREDPYAVTLRFRWQVLRKLYLSMPFRWMRTWSRRLRGREEI